MTPISKRGIVNIFDHCLFKTFIVTIITFVLLIAVTYGIRILIPNGNINPYYILIAIFPFLVYLLFSGKIGELKFSGFEIKFKEEANAEIAFERVGYHDEKYIDKESVLDLSTKVIPKMLRSSISILTLYTEPRRYRLLDLSLYLDTLLSKHILKRILFLEEDGKFIGYIEAKYFYYLTNEKYKEDILEKIESREKILALEGVRTNYIVYTKSNLNALKYLRNKGIDEVAVVDSKRNFLGFTNRELITSSIIEKLISNDSENIDEIAD